MATTEVSPGGDGVQPQADRPEPAATAKQMATAAGSTVKQEIASFASAAQDKVQARVDEQRSTAARAIGDFAAAIQHAGDELADKDQSMAGHLIKQAADQLGQLAHTISDKKPEEMLSGLREFGRRNPAAFAACSALAGFAIGRLVRSSVEPVDEAASGAAAPLGTGGAPTLSSANQDASLPAAGVSPATGVAAGHAQSESMEPAALGDGLPEPFEPAPVRDFGGSPDDLG